MKTFPESFSVTVLPQDIDQAIMLVMADFLAETCIVYQAIRREHPDFAIYGVYTDRVRLFTEESIKGYNCEEAALMMKLSKIPADEYSQEHPTMIEAKKLLPMTLKFTPSNP